MLSRVPWLVGFLLSPLNTRMTTTPSSRSFGSIGWVDEARRSCESARLIEAEQRSIVPQHPEATLNVNDRA